MQESATTRENHLHVCASQPTRKSVYAGKCPDCKQRTRFVGVFYDWYGWDSTCLKCGRQWKDGECQPIEFERGARKKSIEAAKRRFRLI